MTEKYKHPIYCKCCGRHIKTLWDLQRYADIAPICMFCAVLLRDNLGSEEEYYEKQVEEEAYLKKWSTRIWMPIHYKLYCFWNWVCRGFKRSKYAKKVTKTSED